MRTGSVARVEVTYGRTDVALRCVSCLTYHIAIISSVASICASSEAVGINCTLLSLIQACLHMNSRLLLEVLS